MANLDAANGFHWHPQGDEGPRMVYLDIDSGVSGTIGRGQPCKLDSAGDIIELDGTVANDIDANSGGIYIAQEACVAGDTDQPFIDASFGSFVVQADDNASWTTRATLKALIMGSTIWFQINATNTINSDLGFSIAELAGTGPHITAGYLRIVDWVDAPDQEFGPFQNVIVRWNPRLFELAPNYITID